MNAHHRKLFIRKWTRTLHIHLSMLGLLLLVFFASTGLMLNHEEWFGYAEPRVSTCQGTIPSALLTQPDKLAVVELLRKDYRASGSLDSFEVDEDQLNVVFKAPGRRTQAAITRPGGHVEVSIETHGFAGRLVELHRGVDAGFAWRRILDAAALLLLCASLTGLTLWLFVPRWRPLGLVALGACALVCASVYLALVP